MSVSIWPSHTSCRQATLKEQQAAVQAVLQLVLPHMAVAVRVTEAGTKKTLLQLPKVCAVLQGSGMRYMLVLSVMRHACDVECSYTHQHLPRLLHVPGA